MRRRSLILIAASVPWPLRALAHHGWSGFDQDRPLYLEGKVGKVAWTNPHVELMLELAPDLKLPPDLARRAVPAQAAAVDAPKLLAAAQLPTRRDRVWEIELAPLTRMEAWKVAPIQVGESVAVLGFAAPGEKGDPVLRAEYLFAAGKAYGLRSSPA
ncbi:MAG TPA: DUF6152 family protein [Burkholderiaceae bacterium]|nr:DUF6152 family protein [Burkholderiaceae bacterium]